MRVLVVTHYYPKHGGGIEIVAGELARRLVRRGIGVTWEQGLHLHMRRARSLAIEQGNLLFWEDLLVEALTGEAA